MSDLISRKEVLNFINNNKTFTEYKEDGIYKRTNNYVNAALLNSFVSTMPTAYDVDKVTEKISEAVYMIRDTYGLDDDCTEDYIAELCLIVKGVVKDE
jgi:hypothetical protein